MNDSDPVRLGQRGKKLGFPDLPGCISAGDIKVDSEIAQGLARFMVAFIQCLKRPQRLCPASSFETRALRAPQDED